MRGSLTTPAPRTGSTPRRARRCPRAATAPARAWSQPARPRSGCRPCGPPALARRNRTSEGMRGDSTPAAGARPRRWTSSPTFSSPSVRSRSRIRRRIGSPSPREYFATRSLGNARALLRRPRLLLLDEATSQLDAVNEAALRETISEAARDTTVLAVADRLSTVTMADRIVVIDAGKVRAVGTHADLVARDPLYGELAATQFLASAG
jgi:hypothetical protein